MSLAFLPFPGVHALAVAKATTVAIHATVTETSLLTSEGEPTEYGETTRKAEDVCSGFVAYERAVPRYGYLDLIVTARHCMMDETLSQLGVPVMTMSIIPDGVSYKAGDSAPIIAAMEAPGNDDVAFLAVLSPKRHGYAFLAPTLPAQGDNLFVYGMPLQQHFAISPAMMMQDGVLYSDDDPTTPPPPWEHNSYLIACEACGPGDSGGPVFNARGEVVGILNAKGDAAQALMFPLASIRAYLKSIGGAPIHRE
jgi:hypothetical protein